MAAGAVVALCGAAAGGATIAAEAPADAPAGASIREVIGRSAQGRPIVATRIGDPGADRVGLAVGVIHGNERAGLGVIKHLKRSGAGLEGAQLWLIESVNPDGQRAGTRTNAHGVDLNRNFPFHWDGGKPPSSGNYPGPRPASEPETRAVMAFVERIQPDVSIWYHQPWGAVLACHGKPPIAARYARLAGMRTSCQGRGLPGTAIRWEKHEVAGGAAWVVEFPGGALSDRDAKRHARAAAIITRDG
jgi:protein MpaA